MLSQRSRFALLNTRPGPGPGVLDYQPPRIPDWALHALRRQEGIPGKFFPLEGRWQQICPICGAAVFLAGPLYMTPSLEHRGPLVHFHPCRFWIEATAWDGLDDPPPAQPIDLRSFL